MLGLFVVLLLTGFAPGSGTAHAEDRVLTLSIGPEVRRFTAAQLLDRPDAAELTIPADVSYGRPMKYRAVPLPPAGSVGPAFDTIEARAADGFVSQIPLALVAKGATGGSKAWIAIEDALAPWPVLPGKTASAGPFYLVWENPERSAVGSEQWPYQLAFPHGSRVSGAPLAADGGRCELARRCASEARSGSFHDPVLALPSHERRGSR
jgi:hypothetical protein